MPTSEQRLVLIIAKLVGENPDWKGPEGVLGEFFIEKLRSDVKQRKLPPIKCMKNDITLTKYLESSDGQNLLAREGLSMTADWTDPTRPSIVFSDSATGRSVAPRTPDLKHYLDKNGKTDIDSQDADDSSSVT